MVKKSKATGNEILDELVEATGVKQKSGESAQDYAKRLAMTVDKMDDDDWKELSEPTQLWVNGAVTAADAKKDIDLLPGIVGADDGEGSDAEDDGVPDDEEEPDDEDIADEADDDESEETEEPAPKTVSKKTAAKSIAAKSTETKPVEENKKVNKKVDKKVAKTNKAVAKSALKLVENKAAVDKKGKKVAASKTNKKTKSDAEPRAGTKRAKLVEMLSRTKGATVGEICDAFGWVTHTTRGSISMMRKAGIEITSDKDGKRGRVYRIEA